MGKRSSGRSWPANTTAPPITGSTIGKAFARRASISDATRRIAAWTSSAPAMTSEFSRKAQACFRSGMAAILSVMEIARECGANLGMAHAVLHRRLQVAELRAAVEASPGKPHGERALLLEKLRDAVGELDLAARARGHPREQLEDAVGEHVAADHREVRGRVLRRGLLDDAVDTRAVALHLIDGDDAVALRLVARHLLHAEERALFALENLGHARHRRRLGVHEVVGEDDRERIVAHHRLGDEHGVAQAERLRLADVDAAHALRQHRAHHVEKLVLVLALEL